MGGLSSTETEIVERAAPSRCSSRCSNGRRSTAARATLPGSGALLADALAALPGDSSLEEPAPVDARAGRSRSSTANTCT